MSEDNKNDEAGTVPDDAADQPVLSDEEKDALLEGIEKGDVEVHSSKGPMYAEVRDFVISPRAHIISNSFPRLDLLNTQFANLLSKSVEKMIGIKTKIYPGNIEQFDFGALLEAEPQTLLMTSFEAPPLEGTALVCFEGNVVAQLTECFYGGKISKVAPRGSEFFTAGEKRVVNKFSETVLDIIGQTWASLAAITPAAKGLGLSTDIIEGIDQSTEIVSCTFNMSIEESDWKFRVLWPEATIKTLLPALKDQKRDPNPAQDANWRSVISSKLTDSIIRISSQIGQTKMILRDVAQLSAGDIIDIENPRKTVILAKDVPVLEGLFGVHNGQYAIETTRWLATVKESNSN